MRKGTITPNNPNKTPTYKPNEEDPRYLSYVRREEETIMWKKEKDPTLSQMHLNEICYFNLSSEQERN